MPNVRCTRCGGIAYTTTKMATIPKELRADPTRGGTITEEQRLCTICRGKADHENAMAARERRRGRDGPRR